MSTPQESEIRTELERVLGSQTFAQSQRHREFLRYVVEEALAGRGDRIKGYTIAVEVFGKAEDFDAQNDPYVRVEAGRLRKRLAEYYLAEGAPNPIRIRLRKGMYQPMFSRATARPDTDRSTPAQRLQATRRRLPGGPLALAAAAAASLAVVVLLYVQTHPDPGPSAAQSPGFPQIRVQSFENIGAQNFESLAAGLTEEVLVLLNRWQPIVGSVAVFHDDGVPRNAVRGTSDYLLSGTVAVVGDSIRVTASIADAHTGQRIWSEAFNESLSDSSLFEIQDRVAAEIVNIARDPLGPVLAASVARTSSETPVEPRSSDLCYLLFEGARSLAPALRERALTCYATFAPGGSLNAAEWAIVSLLDYWQWEDGADLAEGTDASLPAAYNAAQRALDTDGNVAAAHLALAYVQLGRKRKGEVLDSIDRFFSLNPPLSTRVAAEGLLLRIGATDNLLNFEAALHRSPQTSPYMYIGPSLYELGQGEYQSALEWAERIDAPEYTLAQVLWAALSAHLGQQDRAHRHVNNILSLHPDFPRYGLELIGRWSPDSAVVDRIREGLELAGLALARE